MDDLNFVGAVIVLIPGILLTFFPRAGLKLQGIVLGWIGVKYRDSEKALRNLGVVLILIAVGLCIWAGLS